MFDYFSASILLGIGISIDVMLATLALSGSLNTARDRRFWVSNVTLTHVALPMIGYYVFAYIFKQYPQFSVVLGIAAFSSISWFLYISFKAWVFDPPEGDGEFLAREITFLAVMAVSWDALWSGPAKSSQAVYWSAIETFLSFFIAGVVVFFTALISVRLARTISGHIRPGSQIDRQARIETFALWLEFSILAYFGWLALSRYVFHLDVPWGYILIFSFLSSAPLFVMFWARLQRQKLREIEARIAQNT